jgi:crotonobetainyl-CoA:carnitine CoA-transferase CaiB-like acyl-CoA transferase
MAKTNNRQRHAERDKEAAVLREIMLTRTADEWEEFLQSRHVPASRVRQLSEALADPQVAARNLIHHFPEGAPGVPGRFGVPVAAFKLAHGGAEVTSPPPQMGAHTEEILRDLGYDAAAIAALRAKKVV